MNTPKLNVMNYVIDDQKYYICNICGNRMKKKESHVRGHLKNVHEIRPEDVIENYPYVSTKLRTMGFEMKEWLKTLFIQSNDQKKWQCRICKMTLVGFESWTHAYDHLKEEHFEILIPVAYERSMPGCSSWTGDTIANALSRNESLTAGMSSNISVPFHNEHQEINENIYKFEPRMYVGDTEESRTSIANERGGNGTSDEHRSGRSNAQGYYNSSIKDKRNIKFERSGRSDAQGYYNSGTKDNRNIKVERSGSSSAQGHDNDSTKDNRKIKVERSGSSNAQGYDNDSTKDNRKIKVERSGSSNAQGLDNDSTKDNRNIKLEVSVHNKSGHDIVTIKSKTNALDSEKTNDIGTSANPSRVSSKRPSVTSTSHKTSTKKVKLESSSTDPVNKSSSRDANLPLPDSNTTSNSVSPKTQLRFIANRIIRSMSTEERKSVLVDILRQLDEKRE